MKIKPPQTVSNLKDLDQMIRFSSQTLDLITTEINGRLIFGENIRGQLLTVAFASANADTQIPHGLARVPDGYFQVGADTAMSLYDGTVANNSQNAYLRASSAGTARIFLF